MFHFSWHVLWACKTLVSSVCLKKRYVSPLFAPVCHPPGDSDSESVTIAIWLHLPTQRYIGCHGFTKSLQTQMTQTHIPSFIHFFLMKTQEWKDCYVHRNIGIRGSNAKYETGMKELSFHVLQSAHSSLTWIDFPQDFYTFLFSLLFQIPPPPPPQFACASFFTSTQSSDKTDSFIM